MRRNLELISLLLSISALQHAQNLIWVSRLIRFSFTQVCQV